MEPIIKAFQRRFPVFLASEYAQSKLAEMVRLLNYIRGIGSGGKINDSGEISIVSKLKDAPVVFDVGASVGDYTLSVLKARPNARVHAFEPSHVAFKKLSQNVRSSNVYLNGVGLGEKEELRKFYSDKAGSGLASLTRRHIIKMDEVEIVEIERLDDYCSSHGIENIDLLKVDVEGHEMDVLRGADRMIDEKRIGYVVFEFGGCDVDTRYFFRDFHSFFTRKGMKSMYRILPSGSLLPIRNYTEDLEIFKTANYVVEF